MADYISQLNGEQMDAALMDVALHNSEAWAVGTRNGYDVEQGDATYHNNAKYYAQVAQSAIPGTYTAAVRWDIDQGLAGEAQEQARANISAGASNRNLLDNPWFTNPVNQRNTANGTVASTGYFIDRWITNSANTVALNSASITIMAGGGIRQYLEAKRLVAGTYTVSVLTTTGTVYKVTGTLNPSGTVGSWQISGNLTSNLWCGVRLIDANRWDVAFTGSNASSYITAVKLELGSYSTLANDVPPDYKTELDKCQYYCRVIQGTSFIAVGQAVASTVIRFPLPYVMRTRPTATLTGAAQVYGQGGPLTPSALSCTGNTTQDIEISTTVSGATATQSYMLVFSSANDKIVISADL